MTSLDSRSLSYVNTFGRRFARPGTFRYRLVSAAVACQPAWDDHVFTIEVGEGEGGTQHDVVVRMTADRLVADPKELKIRGGDFVLWHSPAGIPGYVVQSEEDSDRFDSAALTSETLYTHAFGSPGDYEWADALRGSVSGVVRVDTLEHRDNGKCREWMKTLEQGTVVVIEGERAEPAEVSILAGQTVFFAVQAAEGITITDRRLLAG